MITNTLKCTEHQACGLKSKKAFHLIFKWLTVIYCTVLSLFWFPPYLLRNELSWVWLYPISWNPSFSVETVMLSFLHESSMCSWCLVDRSAPPSCQLIHKILCEPGWFNRFSVTPVDSSNSQQHQLISWMYSNTGYGNINYWLVFFHPYTSTWKSWGHVKNALPTFMKIT